jgi:hypothetical protein
LLLAARAMIRNAFVGRWDQDIHPPPIALVTNPVSLQF